MKKEILISKKWIIGICLILISPCIASETGTITVSGRIMWTDHIGGTHPVRYAPVEIRDDELLFSELVTTVYTDNSGYYSVTINNNDGLLEDGRDIFIKVLCRSDGFEIGKPGKDVYSWESDPYDERPDVLGKFRGHNT